jgi:L-alanine-DL-glutamate epimerase-like enolase superfamily enzyme
MQIHRVEVIPMELAIQPPHLTRHGDSVGQVSAVFVRVETLQGDVAWGCAAVDSTTTGELLADVVAACEACADRARDLNPLNTQFALAQLAPIAEGTPSALCAFDIAFHDLLGLAARQPLHRLLGGYRDRIQTSITIGVASVKDTVELAQHRARQGFRILKLKGGVDPQEDVRRVNALRAALPHLTLRLDADQGYSVKEALDVARSLQGMLEMLEQPTPAADLDALRQVTERSPVPILADESVGEPASALQIAAARCADGLSIKMVTCGGFGCARQIDAIARAARLATMVGCVREPALLISAGLAFALSSPNVRYGDLDGHFDLVNDPTVPGFRCQEGSLIAGDVPGLGCTVQM